MNAPPAGGPSDLTPRHRKYLRGLREALDRPPTLGRAYRNYSIPLLLMLAAGAAVVWWMTDEGDVGIACVVGGMIVGALLRDLLAIWQVVRLWPITAAVLDQQKINELLKEPPGESEW